MHVIRTKVRSGKSFKVYVRLVESFRRKDGMPTHRIVANLGEMSDLQYQNIKIALRASREGKAVVVKDAEPWQGRIVGNLEYLDVAVALEMWRSWDLSGLIDGLISESKVEISASDVVCGLTMQRCIAPASKLKAQSWFPRTALPELLGVDPAKFNNNRIHRVLNKLDQVESGLQEGLVRRYQHSDGAFATLFVDVTDTWFEGRGPDLAEKGRTKEGLRNRYKVGILLLCNEQGYPVRWKTLPGRMQDPEALRKLVDDIKEEKWARNVPIVFDRAMGSVGAVAKLSASGLRFVTAVRRREIPTYTDKVPSQQVEALRGDEKGKALESALEKVVERVEASGMEKVNEELYVLDLGVEAHNLRMTMDPDGQTEEEVDISTLEGGAYWLHRARQYQRLLDDKVFRTRTEIGRYEGVSRERIGYIMRLLRLNEELQDEVLAGTYGVIGEQALRRITSLRTKSQQRRALAEHAAKGKGAQAKSKPRRQSRIVEARLRRVLTFNPQMLVEQRQAAHRQLNKIRTFVQDLNLRLRNRRTKTTKQAVEAEVLRQLSTRSMLSVFQVHIKQVTTQGHRHFAVELELDETAWEKKRSMDGFVLFVADPALPHSAADLVALYRAKDAVEKDFQNIKTDLKLRPLYHFTDPKVRAHVSVCMLALLLERTLEHRLRQAKRKMSASTCFELLSSAHLNCAKPAPDQPLVYIPTEPDPDQIDILDRLDLRRLTDRDEIVDRIQPRPSA